MLDGNGFIIRMFFGHFDRIFQKINIAIVVLIMDFLARETFTIIADFLSLYLFA